jgi:hypothetical protein
MKQETKKIIGIDVRTGRKRVFTMLDLECGIMII